MIFAFLRFANRIFSFHRRVRVLSSELATLFDGDSTILDVGCGSGEIAARIMEIRPDLNIAGIDTICRKNSSITVESYNGDTLPVADKTFDYVSLIDVLHHTENPTQILREALRVSRKGVIIKDHNCDSQFNRFIMSITDWLANRPHGVAVPFNFLKEHEWRETWQKLNVDVTYYKTDFGLYGMLSRVIFARNMDFIAVIKRIPKPRLAR